MERVETDPSKYLATLPYVNAVEDGRYLAQAYADRLGKVKFGAASIGFARLDGVDRTRPPRTPRARRSLDAVKR